MRYILFLFFLFSSIAKAQDYRVNLFALGDVDGNFLMQNDLLLTERGSERLIYGFGVSSVTLKGNHQKSVLYGLNAYGKHVSGFLEGEVFTRILFSDSYVPLYDATLTGKPTRWLSASMYSSRDVSGVVDRNTSGALYVLSNGAGMDIMGVRSTLVLDVRQSGFSDGNDRMSYTGKIHLEPIQRIGLSAESKYTSMSMQDVGYFSPSEHWKHLAGLRTHFTTPREHHVIRPSFQYGWEQIDGDTKRIWGASVGGRSNVGIGLVEYDLRYQRSTNMYGQYGFVALTLKGKFIQK